jgi:hypothetical protein
MSTLSIVLDAGASAAAIAVAVIAVITIWKMGEQQREAGKPLLVASGPPKLHDLERHVITRIDNLGDGPAFNVSATLSHPQLGAMSLGWARIDGRRAVPLELTYQVFAAPFFITALPNGDPAKEGVLSLRYWDVYGRQWETRVSVPLKFSLITDPRIREDQQATADETVWSLQLCDGIGNPHVVRKYRIFVAIKSWRDQLATNIRK